MNNKVVFPNEVWDEVRRQMAFNNLESSLKDFYEKAFHAGASYMMKTNKHVLTLADAVCSAPIVDNLEAEMEYFEKMLESSSENDKKHIIDVILLLHSIKHVLDEMESERT